MRLLIDANSKNNKNPKNYFSCLKQQKSKIQPTCLNSVLKMALSGIFAAKNRKKEGSWVLGGGGQIRVLVRIFTIYMRLNVHNDGLANKFYLFITSRNTKFFK